VLHASTGHRFTVNTHTHTHMMAVVNDSPLRSMLVWVCQHVTVSLRRVALGVPSEVAGPCVHALRVAVGGRNPRRLPSLGQGTLGGTSAVIACFSVCDWSPTCTRTLARLQSACFFKRSC
jgi:hypothetical protein